MRNLAIRNIVKLGDDTLRKKCKPVNIIDRRTHELLDDMAQTMYEANGVGLAAPQVGVLKRIVVMDVGQGLIELINPQIVKSSGSQTAEEGCLSCGDVRKSVTRPMKVEVRALDRYGKSFTLRGEELLARCCCHEIDHLDGILFLDRAAPDPDEGE